MPCEGSRQARVWYRDDDGRLQNFKSYNMGVNFTLTREKGANCKRTTSTWVYSVTYTACSDVQFSRAIHKDHGYCWATWLLKAGGTFTIIPVAQAACGIAYKSSAIMSGTFVGPYTYTASGVNAGGDFTISGLFQAQSPTDGFRLKITDKRGQVFDGGFQEKDPMPKIDCGESCPPDTCECACGPIIHCYGRNGQLVKRFNRSAKG